MSGGKGGGIDSGPMIEYGNKALKLQEKIYNQTREDAQPWYQAGSGAVSKLSDLLGVSGGSVKTRDQLLKELTPQYTNTTTTESPSSGLYLDFRGNVTTRPRGFTSGGVNIDHKPYNASTPTTTTSVNQEGLNAALEAALAQQGQTPEGFGSLLEGFDLSKFETEPGYQFRLDEGNKALERKMNAAGKTYSPEAAKALQSYGQGLASEEYGNAYNRYNIDQGNIYNRLAGLAGMGQSSSGQMAGAGQNYAQGGTDLYTGMGNAITSANVAKAQQGSSMFNTLLGIGGQLGSAYLMSDRRLKENVELVGEENGYPLYKFNYINIPEKTYIGVMAQDVEKIMPEAVFETEGYKAVNYDMIGLKMREVSDAIRP